MIKTFHEAPKSVFNYVQARTDGDYALVHLYDTDKDYRKLFKQAVEKGREVILDNSIFELGHSFDMEEYYKHIKDLSPEWYIIPDVLEDTGSTMSKAAKWDTLYRDKLESKCIGVIQGQNLNELIDSYEHFDQILNVDMIAVSFDYSYYTQNITHPNKYVQYMLGRIKLMGDLLTEGVLNTSKKHHLLGNSLPLEGKFYSQYSFLHSVDTSNPCVHTIYNIPYEKNIGLYTKESQKLHELIDYPFDKIDTNLLQYNIKEFRHYWNNLQF